MMVIVPSLGEGGRLSCSSMGAPGDTIVVAVKFGVMMIAESACAPRAAKGVAKSMNKRRRRHARVPCIRRRITVS
jgi:hypothetical protein